MGKTNEGQKAPEATVSPHTETSNPVPSIISSFSPPTDCSTISATSPTDGRAKEGTTFNKTSSGPEVTHIFSVLPFSSEEVISAQQDDITLPSSPSTHQTDRITMINHQDVLYRRIRSEDGQHRLQLVVPKALIQQTLQNLHSRTTERHHGRLKTLLSILEVAWWPTVRKDVWQYVGSCGICAFINQSKEPTLHPATTTTIKPGRRNLQREQRASTAGYRKHQGGTAQPTQGYPGWYRLSLLFNGSPVPSSKLVPAWEQLVLANLFQRHFKSHFKEDTHVMDNG